MKSLTVSTINHQLSRLLSHYGFDRAITVGGILYFFVRSGYKEVAPDLSLVLPGSELTLYLCDTTTADTGAYRFVKKPESAAIKPLGYEDKPLSQFIKNDGYEALRRHMDNVELYINLTDDLPCRPPHQARVKI